MSEKIAVSVLAYKALEVLASGKGDGPASIGEELNEAKTNVMYHLASLTNQGYLTRIDRGRYKFASGFGLTNFTEGRASPGTPKVRHPIARLENLLKEFDALRSMISDELTDLALHIITPEEKDEFERLKKQDEAIKAMVSKNGKKR